MGRLCDTEEWMPSTAKVLAACEAVKQEWEVAIDAARSAAWEREQQEKREAREREYERDPAKRWRDRIASLERSARALRRRREDREEEQGWTEEDLEDLEQEQAEVARELAEARRRLEASGDNASG